MRKTLVDQIGSKMSFDFATFYVDERLIPNTYDLEMWKSESRGLWLVRFSTQNLKYISWAASTGQVLLPENGSTVLFKFSSLRCVSLVKAKAGKLIYEVSFESKNEDSKGIPDFGCVTSVSRLVKTLEEWKENPEPSYRLESLH